MDKLKGLEAERAEMLKHSEAEKVERAETLKRSEAEKAERAEMLKHSEAKKVEMWIRSEGGPGNLLVRLMPLIFYQRNTLHAVIENESEFHWILRDHMMSAAADQSRSTSLNLPSTLLVHFY